MALLEDTQAPTARPLDFSRIAGTCSLGVAVASLGYAISFLIVRPHNADAAGTAASLFLLASGLLTLPVVLVLLRLASGADRDLSLLAAVFGIAGALGAVIHAGYDLALAIHPASGGTDLPSQADPRGLMTFGAAGLSLLLFSVLLRTARAIPPRLASLATSLGALLVLVYILRLTVLNASNPAIVIPAALAGFVVAPTWYALLGLRLRRA